MSILNDQSEGGIANCIHEMLELMGFDAQSPNFKNTPARVARMWKAFLHPEPCSFTSFPLEGKGGMICVKNHECWSFCPHHLLPVKYTVKIGYLPEGGKVLGLSKLARIADCAMCCLPLQEDLAELIARPIIEQIQPKGVGVVIHGEHLCMRMRGVESRCASAMTTFMWGLFRSDHRAREEFLLL